MTETVFGLFGQGVTVLMEFRIDRGSMKLLYYSVIALCMAVVSVLALRCRRKAA